MTTQVSFTADADLKRKALEKARGEGVTLKAILLYSMKAYVDNKIHFGVMNEVEPEIEEVIFDNLKIQEKAAKLARLLK